MPSLAEQHHVYTRDIQPNEHSSLNLLARHVPPNSRVLDLGCGTGALGRWLATHSNAVMDGVTFNGLEADIARQHYRKIVVGDLETLDLVAEFGARTYEAIVCADVLEHLKNPAAVLEQCKALLSPQGQLLISVPNAAYAGLVAELMHGRFTYRDEGLLDKTHLRFFTRSSLLEFLALGGWHVESTETVRRELFESEFTQPFDAIPPSVARYLLTQPDALAYQFIVTARPDASAVSTGSESASSSAKPSPEEAKFSMELFWNTGSGYTQSQKSHATGVIGRRQQVIRFTVAPSISAPYRSLRLDPADRQGFLHLFSLRLTGADGTPLWEWQGAGDSSLDDVHPLPASHQIHWSQLGFPTSAPLLLLLGDDPWFELPIDAPSLANLSRNGGQLEVTAGWPMSADYLHATGAVRDIQRAYLEQRNQAHTLASEKASLELDVANARQEIDSWREKTRIALQERAQLIDSQNKTLRSLDELRNHLQWLENSTVFRLTRPLVRLKMALSPHMPLPTNHVHAHAGPVPAEARRLPSLTQPVDVIIPVYKGLGDTQRCIASVLNSTCKTPWRLVVLNDASPEPEVTAWLREMAASEPRMLLLENPENLGFVGTVNRGMALSTQADVLLLNSDTEVANDWLDRLCATAYAQARNGTVTPFSNNATICSYPRFCEPNALPPGHTTASLDALAAQANPGAAVDVPTGVGFCMYIRRDCLDAVGLFDVPNFGKGYGEENDFCRRALARGWRNLHALDTFVLHSGGVSFGASKSQRELDAMETLRRLHPDYESAVMRFVAEDPAQPYRRALDIARLKASPLAKVLCVVHDRAGGTLRHVRELATALSPSALMLTLTPVPGERVLLSSAQGTEELALEFQVPGQWDALIALLRDMGVSLVHFHHLLGHSPMVKRLPEYLGVPFDFTAHDHYSYCPQISLTDHRNRYCGEKGIDQCRECLAKSPAPGGVDIVTWRNTHRNFLRQARHILAPSADMAMRMERFVPEADVRHVPHLDMERTEPPPPVRRPPPRAANAPLKVVVVGALSSIKGADVLEAVAIAAAKAKAPVEFHLLGYGYRSLKTQPRAHLSVHGEYADADLPSLLEWLQPDLAWFPAQWPETYSYTLSACLQAGLPVVAPNLGAFPERLSGRSWSWVLPWDTATDAWLDFFVSVHNDYVAGDKPAPQCRECPPSWQSAMPAWDYSAEYLNTSIRKPEPSADDADNKPHADAASLRAFLPGHSKTSPQRATLALRRIMLAVVMRLRSMPGLGHAARWVPLRWQTRVKNWLVR